MTDFTFDLYKEVPEHWIVLSFGITNKSALLGGNYQSGEGEEGLPLIKMGNLGRGNINLKKVEYLLLEEKYERRHILKKGDFLFNTRNSMDLVGKVAIWNDELTTSLFNSNILRIIFNPNLVSSSSYMGYMFNSELILNQLRLISKGTTNVSAIYYKELKSVQVLLPPLETQKQIADFLDKETTRIDTLISKKQKQVELLQEKRQTIITQSVTKGLNKNVKMKDSGVEWIGEIPEHWDVIKHSLVLKNLEQGWSPVAENKSVDPGEWGVVKISCISKGKFVQFENKSLIPGTEVRMKHQIRKGDLLMSRGNTVNLVGDVCLVDKIDYQLLFSDLVYRLKYQENKIDKKYVMYFLLSQVGRYQISRDASGSSMTMAKISQENIKSWIITLPPLNEQNKITYEIDLQLSQIDVLKEKETSSIELLKEYRSSLITHAVSGQIDISKYEVSK